MPKKCPLINGECIEHQCTFFTHLMGKNPQPPGNDIDQWACAIAWLPILLVENAAMIRNVAASTDKVASEVSKAHEVPINITLPMKNGKQPILEMLPQETNVTD